MNFDLDEYLKKYFDEYAFEPDINPECGIIKDIRNMMYDNKWIILFKLCESNTFCDHFIDEFFSDYLIEKLKNKKHNDIKQVLEDYNDKFFNILTPEKVNRRLENFDLFFERVENELVEEDFIEFYKIDKLKNLLNIKNLKLFANNSKEGVPYSENKCEIEFLFSNKVNDNYKNKILDKCRKNNYNNDYTKDFILVFFIKINLNNLGILHNSKEIDKLLCKFKDDLKNIITPKCLAFKDMSKKYLSEKDYYLLSKYEIFKYLMTPEELEEFKQDVNYLKKEKEKLGPEYKDIFDGNIDKLDILQIN
jgi:hypothetical protein